MRAVNLLPPDSRPGPRGGFSLGQIGPVHVVLALLVIVLAYVTVYVTTNNSISQRKSQLASLNQQVSQEQAQISRFTSYTQFAQLAQQRAATVRQIAASRFDWHGALTDLSKVMPANATLQSLTATVAAGATVSGAGGSAGGSSGSSGSVRGAISAPAFEMKGCTATQDDVARLISRLRLINDVQRVTLEDSTKAQNGAAGGVVGGAAPSSGPGGTSTGCSANGPTFDLVVFFQPLPGALSGASGSQPGSPAGTTAAAASTAHTAASQAGGASSQPVTSSTGASK
jgi:Tfp pilus assembly protein PilN